MESSTFASTASAMSEENAENLRRVYERALCLIVTTQTLGNRWWAAGPADWPPRRSPHDAV